MDAVQSPNLVYLAGTLFVFAGFGVAVAAAAWIACKVGFIERPRRRWQIGLALVLTALFSVWDLSPYG